MTDRLFVYGTLAPGRPSQHVLAGVPGTWEPATVRGTLLQEGWGAAVGYPGIVLDEIGDRVRGFIFSSEELAAHWARLDEFEAVVMSVSSRRRNSGTARLLKPTSMRSKDTAVRTTDRKGTRR